MAYNKHTWEYGETITASKLNNMEEGIKTNDTAIGNIPETIEEIQTELEQKANVDGAYESMTVGNAEQLVSTQFAEDNAPYVFRTSGGSADIGNREEDTIVGGTVAWNQLMQNGNFADTSGWGTDYSTISVSGNVLSMSPSESGRTTFAIRSGNALESAQVAGHKYLVTATVKMNVTYNPSMNIYGVYPPMASNAPANTWNTHASIFNLITPVTGYTARLYVGSSTAFETTDVAQVKNFMVFDLTQMFGSTIADAVYAMDQANAGSGVAWFKAQYPLDYYAYNTGELKSVEGLVSHDMVGFNQWDEQWEEGLYNGETGLPNPVSGRIRSKNTNPIKVVPNTNYYVPVSISQVCWYDADDNFISSMGNSTASVKTSPSNARYLRFHCSASYGATYNHDICINLHWSGTRDGEYEPYVKRSYALDSTLTLRGIPKVDADGQMYYDGDTYEADGTVTRKYGIMDLGVRTWSYNTSGGYFYTDIAGKKAGNHNLKCAKYVTTTGDSASDMPDKQIKGNATTASIYIKDSAYTDATAFKTAMSGVMLVYELATPTTETAKPYTTPQVVEDWGTEEYVTTGIPVGHETKYPQNLRDKLQHLPVLSEDDGAYLIQQTGTQMHLVNFRIPKAENLADGTYVLKATVSGGTPTYTWEAE